LQGSREEDEESNNDMNLELLGLMFIGFFLIIILIQFCGMIIHR
jgi:hypothetical protein